MFASNLNQKMAQRYYNLVLLPKVRDNIQVSSTHPPTHPRETWLLFWPACVFLSDSTCCFFFWRPDSPSDLLGVLLVLMLAFPLCWTQLAHQEFNKLNFYFYMSLKKAVFKPAVRVCTLVFDARAWACPPPSVSPVAAGA